MTVHASKQRLTFDELMHRRNIHHQRCCCGVFRDSGARYKIADLLTYL